MAGMPAMQEQLPAMAMDGRYAGAIAGNCATQRICAQRNFVRYSTRKRNPILALVEHFGQSVRVARQCYDPAMAMVVDKHNAVLPGRFAYLMGLYAENYHRLTRLFAPQTLHIGSYRSCVDDGLDLYLEVVERHPYTMELHLTYCMADRDTGGPAPSAWLRVYRDAHVAEATHCHPGKRLWHALGPFPPAKTVFEHRMRMASFLNRWLEYLAEQGHSCGTLEPVAPNLIAPGALPHCA